MEENDGRPEQLADGLAEVYQTLVILLETLPNPIWLTPYLPTGGTASSILGYHYWSAVEGACVILRRRPISQDLKKVLLSALRRWATIRQCLLNGSAGTRRYQQADTMLQHLLSTVRQLAEYPAAGHDLPGSRGDQS